MKRLLLSAALAALSAGSAHAAGCKVVGTVGNIQFLSASADNQCNDGDDLKLFIDKTAGSPFSQVGGSLGANNNLFDNINVTTNADVDTDGSGFANFKSVDAGLSTNTLTGFTFTDGATGTLPGGGPFGGFDGQLFRGQIDAKTVFDGTMDVTINFASGPPVTFTFTGLKADKDFGVLGFDEINEPGTIIKSVVLTAGGGGVFNELKQLEFSVPGTTAVIPESSTWAMLLIGFGFLAFAGQRARARLALY